MKTIDQLSKEAASATAVRDAARTALDDLNARLRALREAQAKELAALRDLEAEALAARSEGRAFKGAKLEDARSDARLTKEAVNALQSKLDAQLSRLEETEADCDRATAAFSTVSNASAIMQFAVIVDAVFQRVTDLTGNDTFVRKVKQVLSNNSNMMSVTGDLISEAVGGIVGHGAEKHDVVSAITKIMRNEVAAPQMALDALPASIDLALGTRALSLVEETEKNIAERARREKERHEAASLEALGNIKYHHTVLRPARYQPVGPAGIALGPAELRSGTSIGKVVLRTGGQ